MKKRIKIFLASSINEFKDERNQIGNCIRKLQDRLIDDGIRINLFECEFFDNTVSIKRKQEEYNKEIPTSDIFIMLVGEKIGQYTLEEFNIAKISQVKLIQVIFKDVKHNKDVEKLIQDINKDDNIKMYTYKTKEDLNLFIEKMILEQE